MNCSCLRALSITHFTFAVPGTHWSLISMLSFCKDHASSSLKLCPSHCSNFKYLCQCQHTEVPVVALVLDLQGGIFSREEFLENFLSPAQNRQAGRQVTLQQPIKPGTSAIETPVLPSPWVRVCPSHRAKSLCSRLLCGDSAILRGGGGGRGW